MGDSSRGKEAAAWSERRGWKPSGNIRALSVLESLRKNSAWCSRLWPEFWPGSRGGVEVHDKFSHVWLLRVSWLPLNGLRDASETLFLMASISERGTRGSQFLSQSTPLFYLTKTQLFGFADPRPLRTCFQDRSPLDSLSKPIS